MGLFLELMNILILVTKPFSLFKLLCLLVTRTVGLAFITWLVLVKAFINFQVDLCWRVMLWTVAVLSLPIQILTALQREKKLEMNINEMQIRLDNLIWENKDLKEQLQIAIKDQRVIETIFAEIEEEHDKALARIDLLESELQDLRDENLRLNEVQGKSLWNHKVLEDKGDFNAYDVFAPGSKLGVQSWASSNTSSGVILEDIFMRGNTRSDGNKGKPQQQDFLKAGPTTSGSYLFPPQIASTSLLVDEMLHQRRDIALSQSLFSAILSLLVGMIIWEAEDPCMPLVAALFTVVGMSLSSVVQFFSTIKNKPASDAVALLSFNWFILGTLTYPTLPRVARVLSAPALRLVDQVLSWLGFSSLA